MNQKPVSKSLAGMGRLVLKYLLDLLFWALLLYWLSFAVQTVVYFMQGGFPRVAAWYQHLAGTRYHWELKITLFGQAGALAITTLLYLLRRRLRDSQPDKEPSRPNPTML
jgi:hypothetical protein